MAQPKAFTPVKPVCGIIYGDEALYEAAKLLLTSDLGPVDGESQAFAFDLTDYYEREMGTGLRRRFLSFERLIGPDRLVGLKLRTNRLEQDLLERSGAAGRPVNIDPGYLTASALIMATAKDFSHRVPLGQGIYAHLEFLFTRTGVKTLDWTYPDLRTGPCRSFFLAVRRTYLDQLRNGLA